MLAAVSIVAATRSFVATGDSVVMGSAALLCLLILGTAAANGATSFVAGAKLVEVALGLGVAVLVRTDDALEAIVDVLLISRIADAVGIGQFLANSGGRQGAFLGSTTSPRSRRCPSCTG